MARSRSINSPGVQITEKDLSQYIQPAVGTSVYAMGFAAQGPTDEVLLITSNSELEQIYGVPESPAEKYFHYTCREILNSSGTLLTTRLPYGSGNGAGFDYLYSALLYPVASAGDSFKIGQPTHITLNSDQYEAIEKGNITWATLLSSVSSASFNTSTNFVDAGIVVLNTAQTTINEGYEGYYVTLTDNTDIGPGTDFTSVNTLKSLSANNAFVTVPATILGFALSGTKESLGSGSISEIIESVPTYDFGSNFYKDSLIMTVFKVRSSIYETGTLASSLVESYIGSLDPNKQTIAGTGAQTFYLEDIVNNNSNNVKILVNPNISKRTDWKSGSITSVRIESDNKAVYSIGSYVPTYTTSNKHVGDIVLKTQRALTLVESPELINLDVIVDGGLSTISAVVSSEMEFDDSVFVNTASLSSTSSDLRTRWRAVFNAFNNFVQSVRKDCVFISDPLRYIFVNGADTKVSSLKNYNFSTNTYTPLKNLFSGIESNYAATYGNWVKVFDAYSDKRVWVPVSGFAAAAFARTDATAQPWIAPAGLTRGVINNIVDIGFNPNQSQRDYLYPLSINPVVFFNNDGFVIFGQKTLQTRPSAFDRINVRRLFLALEKSVQRSLRFFVFEPNTEFTRTRLKNTITPVFELAKNTEGLYDYLIVCDERNNTPDTIDRNELNVDIYIKPVRAAEFILVNFIATKTGQNFQELI
jgi:Phage tail sheath protein subtilisin-like domain/Phage tail sheath C-terminal domain